MIVMRSYGSMILGIASTSTFAQSTSTSISFRGISYSVLGRIVIQKGALW